MAAGAAFERDEMVKLLRASALPAGAIDNFERCHVGTITRFRSHAVRKLVSEPPHAVRTRLRWRRCWWP